MIYRLFAPVETNVPPSELMAHLSAVGFIVEPHFRGDDLGWTGGTLVLPGGGTPVQLERWLTTEDDLRDDLNNHAAELETMTFNPHHTKLMELVIQTKQLIAIRKPIDHADDAGLTDLCEAMVHYFAGRLDAICQIDGEGWYSAAGELLLPEY